MHFSLNQNVSRIQDIASVPHVLLQAQQFEGFDAALAMTRPRTSSLVDLPQLGLTQTDSIEFEREPIEATEKNGILGRNDAYNPHPSGPFGP